MPAKLVATTAHATEQACHNDVRPVTRRNFVRWGKMHGVAIVFALCWRVRPSPRHVVGWATIIGFFLLSGVTLRTATLDVAWNIYSGLARLPRMLSKAWIVGLRMLLGTTLPAMQELSGRINSHPTAWVPAGQRRAPGPSR
jgi:hypothetical protein